MSVLREDMFSSVLQGWRAWKSARAVGALAVAALAIGIGSTTAIYTVVHAVMLKPLPYTNPDRYFLVFGAWRPRVDQWTTFSYPDYLDYAPQLRTVEAFGVFTPGDFNVTINHQALHVAGTQVSASLVRSFGVSPVIGQWFEQREKRKNDLPGAVLSMRLWRRAGSDPNIVGKALTINGEQFTITGVAPGWFRFPVDEADNDLWVPAYGRGRRTDHYLRAMAKLKPGATPQQATEDFNRILAGLQKQYPGQIEPDLLYLQRVLDFVLQGIRPSLLLLLGAAVALLFITCANVASLLLARSVARLRETATRVALGARLWQLGLGYFSEGLMVSLGGAAGGILLSLVVVRAVLLIEGDRIPRADQIGFDGRILAFTLLVAVSCALLFSLAPLWQARRMQPNEVLAGGARLSASATSRRLLQALVVLEIALAFGLAGMGGMALQQLSGVSRVDPGFDPNNLLVMEIYASYATFHDDPRIIPYESALADRIQRIPGVESAGFTSVMPLVEFGSSTLMYVEGRPKPDAAHSVFIEQRWISPDYLQTMRVPLLRGRFFTADDKRGSVMPMIINQTLSKLYWPQQDPLGSYVTLFGYSGDNRFRIIGVVGDVRNGSRGLAGPPAPEFYLSFKEASFNDMTWAVRSRMDPAQLVPQLRRAVSSVDPDQPIFNVRSMRAIIRRSLGNQRLQSLMVGFFAIAALFLSVLGVYGVVAYAVRQRLTEMGTRMALGAAPGDLLRLVLREGGQMAAVGIGIGVALVLVAAHLLKGSAGDIASSEFAPLLFAALLIAACTLLACWIPAWRASTLSPMVAIRSDLHPSLARLRVSVRELSGRVSSLITEGSQPGAGSELLTALADASRNAQSFAEAIQAALLTIRDEVRAASATLLTHRAADEPYRCTATTLENGGRQETLSANAILLRRLSNYSSALPFSRADLAALRLWASEHAPQYLAEIEMLQDVGVALAVPVLSKTAVMGVLLLGSPVDRSEFNSAERRAVRTAAAQLALMLDNARLTDRIVEQERVTRDLELAGEVQKRLFPQPWRGDTTLQMVGTSIPARGVGGDCYDFLDLGDRQVGVALADVAGKGIAAALVTSVVQATLRSLADQNGRSLSDLASKMNRLLHRSTGVNSYATFFYAQFDEESRRLRYVNAGHNPPFLLRAAESSIEELATGGMIIGMFAQASYQEASVQLAPGDVLLLFSDGVSEANDPQENEFGEERLKELLRRTAHLPVKEMAAAILQELKNWMADAAQFDDVTFVVMKVI